MRSVKFWLIVMMVTVVAVGCLCDAPHDDWIDPYDMENFDHDSKTMKNKKHHESPSTTAPTNIKQEEIVTPPSTAPESDKQNKGENHDKQSKGENHDKKSKGDNHDEQSKGDNKESCSRESSSLCLVLFRRYVNSLLHKVRAKVQFGIEDLNFRIKLSQVDIEYLEKFTDPSSNEKEFHNVNDVLSGMVKHVSEVTHGDPSVSVLWIEALTGTRVHNILMFGSLGGLALVLLYVFVRINFSWSRLAVKLIFFIFVISVFWQWYELYKKEETKQHMTIVQEMPDSCRKREKDLGIVSSFFHSLTSAFSFKSDECLEYYEHLLIDPFWKVAPTKALGKTVIRFFVDPMKDVGEAFREFLTGLLKDLPVQLWPVVLGAIATFAILLLFMYFGYRLTLPFGLIAIEPGGRGDNSQMKAITQQGEQMKALQECQEKLAKQITCFLDEEHKSIKEMDQWSHVTLQEIRDTMNKACQISRSSSIQPADAITRGDNYDDKCLASQKDPVTEINLENQKLMPKSFGEVSLSPSNMEPDTVGRNEN